MNEYELKYLTTQHSFEAHLKYFLLKFSNSPIIKQDHVNYYYDTEQMDFRKKHTTLRVRQQKNKFILCSKVHYPNSFHSTETETLVRNAPLILWHNGTLVHLFGKMNTKRTKIFIKPGLQIDFDSNAYLGKMDYEIEIEYYPKYKAEAFEISNGLYDCRKNNKSKSERFFTQLEVMIKNES